MRPRILDAYTGLYLGASIQVFDTRLERGLQMLSEGKVDLVIGTEVGQAGEFDVRRLFREPYLLACQARHPLAGKKVIQRRHLSGLSMIYPLYVGNTVVASGGKLFTLRDVLESSGVRDSGIAVEHLASVTAIVAAGMGVSIVPHLSRAQFASSGVALVPIARAIMMREVYLIQRASQGPSVAADRLAKLVDDHTPEPSEFEISRPGG